MLHQAGARVLLSMLIFSRTGSVLKSPTRRFPVRCAAEIALPCRPDDRPEEPEVSQASDLGLQPQRGRLVLVCGGVRMEFAKSECSIAVGAEFTQEFADSRRVPPCDCGDFGVVLGVYEEDFGWIFQ